MWVKSQCGSLLNLDKVDSISWRDRTLAGREEQRGYVIVANLSPSSAEREEVIGVCKTKTDLHQKMAELQHIIGADQKLF